MLNFSLVTRLSTLKRDFRLNRDLLNRDLLNRDLLNRDLLNRDFTVVTSKSVDFMTIFISRHYSGISRHRLIKPRLIIPTA